MIKCFPMAPSFNQYLPGNFPAETETKTASIANRLRQNKPYPLQFVPPQNRKSTFIWQNVKLFLITLRHFQPFPPGTRRFSLLLLPLLLSFCVLCGCVKKESQTPAAPGAASSRAEIFTSGDLSLKGLRQTHAAIYIEVQGQKYGLTNLPALLKARASNQFQIVENPGKASFILHVAILQEGHTSLASLRKSSLADFGSEPTLAGKEGAGILADVLLVTRRVPEKAGDKAAFLENVSTRNTLDSSQMRIGIYVPEAFGNASRAMLEQKLADAIEKALSGQ